jgi:hypothetical protein
VAAAVAVLLSLTLHAVAIRQLPPLPIGQTTTWAGEERLPPVVLGDVRRQVMESLERPDRFRAEDPEVMRPEALSESAFQEMIETLVPAEPADLGVSMAGESAPLAPPEAELERDRWDARQDIVQIRDAIIPDEIAALPRRYTPDIDRVQGAPDIALPVESPAAALLARGETRAWEGSAAGSDRSPYGAGMRSASEADALSSLPDPLDRPDVMAETPEDISEVAAIEKLLALDLTVFNDPSDPDYRYFEIGIRRAGEEALPVLPRDILLIQDASASLTQRTLDECKKGLHRWLERMNPGDRFDVIAFRDEVDRCFSALTPFTAASQARGAFFVESLRARGGTDVYRSLESLTGLEVDSSRAVIAVFISDGVPTSGVVDSTDIIQRFSNTNEGRVSMFGVGGGPRVNKYLLDFLSYKNRGDAKMMADRSDIVMAMDTLAKELSRPVLIDLRCRVSGDGDVEVYPRSLTHLYLDRPLVIQGRAPRTTPGVAIQVLGRSGDELKDMIFLLDFNEGQPGPAEVRTAWAWQKVYHLVGEHIQNREPAVLEEIRRMSSAFGLRLLYGSDTVPMRF